MKHYSNVLTQKDHYFQAISSEQEKYNTFIPGKSGRGQQRRNRKYIDATRDFLMCGNMIGQ